ncbi:Uncharacterised protein [Comamonas testosteroni]|uniref:Uncharacterized protein n=1 Tax=Comamonas testosteroni TaxID=285 RepID=A0A8B4S7T5_COMTE|nr:hypothetical protein DFO48_11099 [Comamonas sp. AG1104]SUY78966.1 Uncharacterised protein [Comamonas testosteroni]
MRHQAQKQKLLALAVHIFQIQKTLKFMYIIR